MLGRICSPDDMKNHTYVALEQVAADIRQDAIATVLVNGCHPASNLGTVKVTIALHRVFANHEDKITRGVGHQAYAREPLTDLKESLPPSSSIATYHGFPNTWRASTMSLALCMPAPSWLPLWEWPLHGIWLGTGIMRWQISTMAPRARAWLFKALNSADGLFRKLLVVVLNDNLPSLWVQNLLWARPYRAKREEKPSSERRSRV